MRDIDIKVIKFLISGKAYSDMAVMKNLGITKEELNESYNILIKNGYLESYNDYVAKTQNGFNSKKDDEYSPSCGSCCGGSCGGCSNNFSDDEFEDIKVVTDKAIKEFE